MLKLSGNGGDNEAARLRGDSPDRSETPNLRPLVCAVSLSRMFDEVR